MGQAQASPKAKRAHLAAAHERETQSISKETRQQSEATTSRQIRRIHMDLRAHQSYQTDSRQAMTHIHNMRAHPAAFRPRTGPNGLSPRSADLQVARPSGDGPRAPPPLKRHVVRCGWSPMTVWLVSRARGWWLPPINTRGGVENEDNTHHTPHHLSS